MTLDEAKQRGKELFSMGYNCAQAVVGVFCETMGLAFDDAMRLSCPFGGGFGRTREVCGAVSGMCMILGLSGESFDPSSPTQKGEVYARTQELLSRFKEQNGSIICRELLQGVKTDSSPNPEKRTEEYYKKRPCQDLVADCVEIIYHSLAQKGIV